MITLSIYFAFALNRWSENENEKKLESFYLQNIQKDVERSIKNLEFHLRSDTSQLKGAERLDHFLEQGIGVNRDSLIKYLNSFNTNPEFKVDNYSYQSILQSGDYRMIKNEQLRNLLDRFFLDLIPSVVSSEGYYLDRLNEHYFPIKETVFLGKSQTFLKIERLFDPVFIDTVWVLPAYIRQEMRQLSRALEAANELLSIIKKELA